MDKLEIIKRVINRQILKVPMGFWDKETAVLAVRYLIVDYLKYSRDNIYEKFTIRDLSKYGLRSVRKYGSTYELVTLAVPEFNLMPWELKKLPNEYWTDEHIKEAIDWLVYEVLDTTPEKAKITGRILIKNKLLRVYTKKNRSIKAIMETAYPVKYFGIIFSED